MTLKLLVFCGAFAALCGSVFLIGAFAKRTISDDDRSAGTEDRK